MRDTTSVNRLRSRASRSIILSGVTRLDRASAVGRHGVGVETVVRELTVTIEGGEAESICPNLVAISMSQAQGKEG